MLILKTIFLAFILCKKSNAGINVHSVDHALDALTQLIKNLSSKELSWFQVFLTDKVLLRDENVNIVLSTLKAVQLSKLNNFSKASHIKNAVTLVWICDDSELTQIFNQQIALDNIARNIILIFLNNNVEHSRLADVFIYFAAFSIYNVNVLTLIEDNVVMVSVMPFQESECRTTSPAITNVYQNTLHKWEKEEMFPQQFKNFHKCPLRISTLEYPPAVMKKIINGTPQLYGSDVEVIRGLSSAMNFTVNFSHVAEPYNFGEIFSFNNSTGAISHAVSGNDDIAMGFYFLSHDKLKYLAHSYP